MFFQIQFVCLPEQSEGDSITQQVGFLKVYPKNLKTKPLEFYSVVEYISFSSHKLFFFFEIGKFTLPSFKLHKINFIPLSPEGH